MGTTSKARKAPTNWWAPDQGDAAEVGMGIYGLYPNVKSPKSHSRHSQADGPVSETKGPRFEEMRRCGDLAGQSHGE